MAETNPIKYSDLIKPDNSIEDLIKQLGDADVAYKKMAEDIKAEAAAIAKALEAVSGATESGRTVTRKAATDADKLAKAERDLAFASSETALRLEELNLAKKEQNQINRLIVKINNTAEGSYARLSAQYSLNKIYLNNMTQEERDASEAREGLVTQTRELYDEMKRLQEETGKYQLNVGNYPQITQAVAGYSDKALEAVGLNNDFGKSLLALGQGGEEAKAVFTAMGDGAKALGKTLLGLLTNPVFLAIAGVAAAGAAFKWWYDYNAGLVEATRLTQQFTSKEGDALQAYRNEVQAVADAFDVDFKETLIAANALAQQFGISADEALKLVKDGFIAGGDANGEFLDTLKEYPAYFREAGISADQFVAIVAQTNKAGIFSDKGVDAIKEANLRLREMTTATAAALDGIGISSVKVQEDLQTGAKTTFEVMQDVSARLNELPDSAQAVGTAIADIFGGPGEDAGLQYLRTLKDISTDLDTVKDKAGLLGQLQEEQLQSQIELQNAISGLFDLTGGTFETLTTRVKVFVNEGLSSIIKGIISIANYFIDFYNDFILLRVVWQNTIASFKTGFDFIGNLFQAFGDVLRATGKTLKGAFTLDWDEFKEGLTGFATAIPNMIKTNMKDAGDNFREGLDNLDKKIKPITIPVSVGGDGSGGTSPVTTDTPTVNTTAQDKAAKAAEREAERQRKLVEDAYKKNLTATRNLQDAQLALETDTWKRRTAETKLQYERQIEDLQHQLETEEKLTEAGREAINLTIEALERQKTEALLKLEQERQLQELELQKKGIELRLQAVKAGSEEEYNLRMQLNENARQTALLQNRQLPADLQQDEAAITASFGASAAKITDDYLNAQLAQFDLQQELAQSEFELLRNSEERKTQFRLKAEQDRLRKILKLNETAANKLSEEEIAIINNTIAQIDREISQSKAQERSGDIYGLFGLNLDENQKSAINTSVDYAKQALQSYLDAYVAAADEKVNKANSEVDAAQRVLDAELEARANGYANNVAIAQKELELARKTQAQALADQQKAQKAQAAIQTIQQIGDMVTASAMIWSQLGFPLAIPAIAIMWGSFAASKIKATQLAKQNTEAYGDGTVELLQGGSHQSGHDIDLGTKLDGTRRRAEGGEFFAVINKRNSRRFRRYIPDVINSLNNGTFAEKYLKAYDATNGISLNIQRNSPNLTDISNDVRLIRESSQRRTYTDGTGRTITEYKNLKRKIN